VLQVPTLTDLRLLGVRYLIVPQGITSPLPPGISGRTIETEGAYRLVEIDDAEPRVSVVPSWTVVSGERAALDAVLEPGFDPAAGAVLESEPGSTPALDGLEGNRHLPGGITRGRPDRGGGLRPVDPARPQRLGRGLVGDARRPFGAGAAYRWVPPGDRAPPGPP
jgi:hypothetical protein